MQSTGLRAKLFNNPDAVLTVPELKELEQKLQEKILGCSSYIDHVSEENFSNNQFLYLLNSLQEKHIEQVLLLQRIKTWVTSNAFWLIDPECKKMIEEVI